MITHNVKQGTAEWLEARKGIVTCSDIHKVLAKGEYKTRNGYLYIKAGEIITNRPSETYKNDHMLRGQEQEPQARLAYELQTRTIVDEAKFYTTEGEYILGCSPDGLVGETGIIEIKSKLPHLQAEILDKGVTPSEHWAQIQGALFVTGREYCDFIAYCPDMPLFVQRHLPDEGWHTKISADLMRFYDDLKKTVAKIREYQQ